MLTVHVNILSPKRNDFHLLPRSIAPSEPERLKVKGEGSLYVKTKILFPVLLFLLVPDIFSAGTGLIPLQKKRNMPQP